MILASVAPGLIAGTQLAGLLFFLNPHLPFQPVPVLRGVATYASLLGLLSVTLLLPWGWRRPARALRWLPWSLTVVLAATATAAWLHAYRFAYYLPPGINARLLKAAVWLTLGAVIGFYTAWLHQLRQRRYGVRSRVLLVLVALASIYVMMERREAFRPPLGPGPRPTSFAGSQRPHLLVVGIDTASFEVILPLAEQGWLPFFSRLMEEGARGRLRPLRPKRQLPLWTSVISGKYPYKHGVLGPLRYPAPQISSDAWLRLIPGHVEFAHWGVWGATRATDAHDREVLALWDILERLEMSSGVVAWPLTSPPPEVTVAISDDYFATGDAKELVPAALLGRLRRLRPDRGELTTALGAVPIEEASWPVVEGLRGDLWRGAVASALLAAHDLDALFLQLPGLRAVSAGFFGGYVAAQFEGRQGPDEQLARELVVSYYRSLDRAVARLWEQMPEPRLVAVVSPHGVGARGDVEIAWRRTMGLEALAGDLGGTPDGVLLLHGPGVRSGALPHEVDLVDLVPTLLYALGFPIARDFDGAVATAAFDDEVLAGRSLTFVPSYETFAAPAKAAADAVANPGPTLGRTAAPD